MVDSLSIGAPAARRAGAPGVVAAVCGWELRRVVASRSTLAVAAGVSACFLGLVAFKHQWLLPVDDRAHVVAWLYGSSPLGQTYEVAAVVITFFGLLVPATQPGFPAPDVRSLLALWAVLVLPAGVLLAGAGFLGGTLAPRLTAVVKVAVVLAWIALAAIVDLSGSLPWFPYWSPSGNALLGLADRSFARAYLAAGAGPGAPDPAAAAHAQRAALDLTPWLPSHLGLVALGLAAAAVAAACFRRFRGQLQARRSAPWRSCSTGSDGGSATAGRSATSPSSARTACSASSGPMAPARPR
jgi:hypothetical protein